MAVEDEASSAASFFVGTLNSMRMKWLDGLVLFYGIVLILGGIDGYLHHSVISLIAGGVSGILEIGFATLTQSKPRIGRIGAAVVALLIAGRFVPAAISKPSKAGIILAAMSVIVLVCLLGGHFYAMSQRKPGLND